MKNLLFSITMVLALSGNAFASWSIPIDVNIPVPDKATVIADFGTSGTRFPPVRVIIHNTGSHPVIVGGNSIASGAAFFYQMSKGTLVAIGQIGPGKITIQFDGL